MENATDLLNAGMQAVRSGNRDEGRRLLQAALRVDPKNEQAWLWLSGVLDDPIQQRDCLQRVLALNPQNSAARRGLERLASLEAASFMAAFNVAPAEAKTVPPSSAAPQPSAAAPPPAPLAAEIDMAIDQRLAALGLSGGVPVPGLASRSKLDQIELPPTGIPAQATLPPPLSAPCFFCATPDVTEICPACALEQSFDCPNCALPIDLRKTLICRCGHNFQAYLRQGGVDHERLAEQYALKHFTAAAIKQWNFAIPISKNPQLLHKRLASAYRELGLFDRALEHQELARKR